ncbi:diguanylate cyclase [Ideonella sp. DXS29W]|uniref:diguanylate cyclase n=1 Tax=Ideonella lacteola TaxID=2984193 RepID=A0ABU9BXY9_9BURK
MAAAEDDPLPPMPRSKKSMLEAARTAIEDARAARVAGEHRAGVAHAQRALGWAQEAGHQGLCAAALSVLALNEYRLGDCGSAVSHCQQALPLLRRTKDAAERTQVLCTLVMAHNEMGLRTDALNYATQAIESARQANDPSLMSWALNRAGLTYEELGDPRRGEPLMAHALEIAREVQGHEEMFSALNNLCSNLLHACKLQEGEQRTASLERAIAYGMEALGLAEASGNAHREAVTLSNLANAHVMLGDFDRAEPYIDRQEALATANGYRSMLLLASLNRAELARYRGQWSESAQRYEQVLAEADETDNHDALLEIHQGLYAAYKQLGDFKTALHHLETVLPLEREHLRQRADRQAQLLLNRIEIENMQAAADRARTEADAQRLRATELESENRRLADRAVELGRHAMEDQLTGLANRRRVEHELPQQLEAARLRQTPLCLAAIDLDHFKQVNDHWGHAVGDDVLRAVAQLLVAHTRGTDLVARLGGEEFIVVLGGTPLAMAREVCERLRQAVASHDWQPLGAGLKVTISVGLCAAEAASSMRDLMERADALLYAAKRGGRNRVESRYESQPAG